MKYADLVFKIIVIALGAFILYFTVRLVRYVDDIGLMIYQSTKTEERLTEIKPLPNGYLFSGSDSAIIKMTVFIDFECSFCRKFFIEVIPEIEDKYVNNGLVVIYTKHLPLTNIHPFSELFAKGAVYSQMNDSFKQYVARVFMEEPPLSKMILNNVLNAMKIDTLSFRETLSDYGIYHEIREDITEAEINNISGTPTIIVNNKVIVGYRSFDYFKNLIEAELNPDIINSCN